MAHSSLLRSFVRGARAIFRRGRGRTTEVDPRRVRSLRLAYAPRVDGRADAGEIVWTWVPYAENDGRGKDRPVLVIARAGGDAVYAVKLTSRDRDGNREFVPVGSGGWDARGRTSWVDVDQLYRVPDSAVRREAAALDLDRFVLVARELQRRYGWSATAGRGR
ncbi:type II toxin-antitoxin system PemK/MazF family toxin [Microbacterium sp. ZXX196]|uniref:type II toxin-antitoxin system PemK/MazF family toxin n=1 Tax=Microbacterium sp. ZXX196 TaxID=2609291 RepID=UPI0012B996A6|nr:type II toxin-antitoxin system PemK/MazF family toxin [Microbacterium sp. ZXX196]MTE24072.1 type II toxin-antitoxin system PemK/MazF family toxin [Microbacterium sp. ZXX196]